MAAARAQAWWRPLLPALAVPVGVGAVSLLQLTLAPGLGEWGIVPRAWRGLFGIALAPLLHGDAAHLASNLLPMTLLLLAAAQLYPSFWLGGLAWVWLGGGALVWLAARPGTHLGGSGLVFGLTGLLLVSGLLRRERAAMTAAMLALFLNQGLIWGMLPLNRDVSWEAHAYSFAVGAAVATAYRHRDRPPDDDDDAPDDPPDPDDPGPWNYQRHLAPHQRPPRSDA